MDVKGLVCPRLGGGRATSVGFTPGFTTKPLGFSRVSLKTVGVPWLRLKAKTRGSTGQRAAQASLTTLEGRSDRVGRSNHPGGAVRPRGPHGVEKVRSGGHAAGLHGLRRGEARCGARLSVQWKNHQVSSFAPDGRVST